MIIFPLCGIVPIFGLRELTQVRPFIQYWLMFPKVLRLPSLA
jgi:hypothetical protein